MENKWYSNGLSYKNTGSLIKLYGKINWATFLSEDKVKLDLRLENRAMTSTILESSQGIEELLKRTNASDISNLGGKVIETYWSLNGNLQCISVNENLV